MLRAAREGRGLSAADIAQRLKFSTRQVEALESDDYASLNGTTMVKGMIRGYARLVGVEPEPVLASFQRRHVPSEVVVDLRSERIPFPDGAQKGNRAYLILSVLIVIAAAGVIYEWQFAPGLFSPEPASVKIDTPPVSSVPANEQAGAEAPSAVAAPAPVVVVPPVMVPAPAPLAAPVNPMPGTSGGLPLPSTPLARYDASAGQGAQATRAAEARIRLEFGKDAWVEIRDRGGRMLLSQMNPAGSERMVEGRPPFELVIGNAPNVRLHYNDQPVDLKPHFRVDVARLTLP
jgi:cytoskeleton protein RodZ